ncbi:MAG: pilus (MSHA type) biogenesis protein MshL [Gammaproteobacteria bacterium]|jgi:MSHA biogenesis protein MshL|nr:pilus (MSHA type) biogenesis protein MshL [Gammaproteobacteria bacterium]MBT3723900.1 pilus (MSHA type) biogenesis protein MshL [Gammaproteobacteria bacterium]MBT4078151.1 pilus (MSHA type) biogenesis protein MshL [Gammaproteobacteria bacterium]
MMKLKLLLCAMLVLLSACSTRQIDSSAQETRDSIRTELEQAGLNTVQQPVVPSADIMNELMPATGISIPGLEADILPDPRFDISVANASADVFFMSLVSGTDINMIVHPSVSGTISLDLKKVTIKDVMELTREVYGYEYKKTGNGYIVLPARIQSRIFHVNYLNINRDGESSMTVSSGQIASSGSSDSDSGQDSSQSSTSQSSSIKTSSKANFWAELYSTITSIVGKADGRSVVVDRHAGLIIVRAMPGELRDVEEYLSSAQENLQRQVILEAKIIEVQLNDSFQSGVDWAALAESSGESLFLGQSNIIDGNASLYDVDGNIDKSAALSGLGAAGFANLFAIGGTADNFGALLRLLSNQGEVQVLSSPRVSTLNNQKAVIKVGSDEFFVTEVSSTTSAGATSTVTTPDITLTPFFSGIALDVTPQISQDGEVILHIHPSVSEVKDQTKNITLAGQTQQLPLALSTVRESDSVVKARSGQIIVIGGLMQNRTANDDGGVPVLSKVPILGNLFKQTSKQNTRSELVILLKPIVVNSERTWTNYIKQSQSRIDQLQQTQQSQSENK